MDLKQGTVPSMHSQHTHHCQVQPEFMTPNCAQQSHGSGHSQQQTIALTELQALLVAYVQRPLVALRRSDHDGS